MVPKPSEVPNTSLKDIVAPGHVESLMGATASVIDIGEVGGATKHQDVLVVSLELPPILNPPSTGEEDISLKPLTNKPQK